MAKTASQRRFAKRASALAQLAHSNPERVKQVLDTMVHGWVNEARYRAAAFRYETEGEAQLMAFAVIEHAQRSLLAIGPQAVTLGQGVLETLCTTSLDQAAHAASTTTRRRHRADDDPTERAGCSADDPFRCLRSSLSEDHPAAVYPRDRSPTNSQEVHMGGDG